MSLTKQEVHKEYYYQDSSCSKCSGALIEDTFCGVGDPANTMDGYGVYEYDCIKRVCQNCNYTWHVHPIDHPDHPGELPDE